MDQVANLLGLHVKTVRSYVRDGRLKATRVGKQYRITSDDLEAFTGTPAFSSAEPASHAEVSSVVHVDAIGPDATMRLTNTVMAAVNGHDSRQGGDRLRIETIYDEDRGTIKIVILGGLETTAEILRIINTLIEQPQ